MAEAAIQVQGLGIAFRAATGSVDRAAGPYENWTACEVSAEVPGFASRFQWNAMPEEFLRLARDLDALHANFPKTGTVTFSPTEPNVQLTFEIRSTGAVAGAAKL